MNKIGKITILIILVVVIVASGYRIIKLNHDRSFYTVHEVELKDGDEFSSSNVKFHFGKVGEPVIEPSDVFEGENKVIYEIPITIENQNEQPFNLLGEAPVAFFENYRSYYNAVPVYLDEEKEPEINYDILTKLPTDKAVHILVKTDLAPFSDYSDYSADKEARVVLVSDPSPEGIKAYYYRLNTEKE